MASTTLTPTKPEATSKVDDFGRGGGGGPGEGGGWREDGWTVPARTYRLGMWFALGAIVMLFAAFTSALVVRKGLTNDWVPIALPRILWLNTFVLLTSSATLELSRRALTAGNALPFIRWLYVTAGLGLGFLVGQLMAWFELARRGGYLATNPSSSFFYLLTATHGVHLLGGILALFYLVARAGTIARAPARRAAPEVVALYWHFMDGLWIYIFLLLARWS